MRVWALLGLLLSLRIPEFHGIFASNAETTSCSINCVVHDVFNKFVGLSGEDDVVNAFLEINRPLQEKETQDLYNASATWQLLDDFFRMEQEPLRYEEFGITSLLRHSALDISSDLRVVSLELEKLAEFSRYWVSLRKLVKYLTSPVDNDIKIRLRNAHHLAVNEWRGSGALGNLATYLEEHPTNLCRFKRSAKQVLYMMYMACTLGQLRGSLALEFSYKFLAQGNATAATNTTWILADFEKRSNKARSVLEEVMASADDTVVACDADKFKEGITYERVTHFAQGVIVKDHLSFVGRKCDMRRVIDCETMSNGIDLCSSNNTERRYDTIQSYDAFYGTKCNGTKEFLKWRNYWWIIPLPTSVSYALCICYENEDLHLSDRYFSLKEAVSNTKENSIVTGVLFRKKDRVFHLQIQEGHLGAEGSVDSSTVQWKKLPINSVNDTSNQSEYHTLKYNERAIDLNEVKGPAGHVLTGVRFVVSDGHLNLQAKMSLFDFATGQLGSSAWVSSYETTPKSQLKEIILDNPDIPTEVTGASEINRKVNQFIKFTTTGRKADAAQTTIPYLDTQEVFTKSYAPLSGLGLYHKASEGSGGFIGPRIYTYDLSAHCKINSVGR